VISVGGDVLIYYSGCVGSSSIVVVCGVFARMWFYNPAMSSSAFLTAITMGVFAVAVSKFSIYLNLFLWFSTLKFTPATMSKKSIVSLSFA
jgi:hypothetical protein